MGEIFRVRFLGIARAVTTTGVGIGGSDGLVTGSNARAIPLDGGVFDVTSTDEVIMAISPKLFVGDAVLFAVTVETPRGAVVTRCERFWSRPRPIGAEPCHQLAPTPNASVAEC
jgi:hypothetical protein